MFTKRISKVSAGLVMLAVAFVGVSFFTLDISSRKASGNSSAVSNTYLPLPPGKQTLLFNAAKGADDFYQRHPDWTWAANNGNAVIPMTGDDAFPDYYQRHPELSVSAAASSDTTDYYFRHSAENASSAGSSIDSTDYYFRHINGR